MKLKKRFIPTFAALATVIVLTGSASAHTDDYSPGYFPNQDGAHLFFRVGDTAQTSLLKYDDVYKYASDWNNISDNVTIQLAMNIPGMPTLSNIEMPVVGDPTLGNTLGRTLFFKTRDDYYEYLRTMDEKYMCTMHHGCDFIMISMNTSDKFYETPDATASAKKTFVHEVGHALRLKHPEENPENEGHTYGNGLPYAVMNQLCPCKDHPEVAQTVAVHDIQNLKRKWGA